MNIISSFNHDFAWYFIFSYRSEITYPFKSYKTSRTKRKKMCLTKYVLSRQFSGTCVTQNSDYHLRYELCFIIYVRKHKKFTINSVPGIEAFKMIIMMLRKNKNETSRLIWENCQLSFINIWEYICLVMLIIPYFNLLFEKPFTWENFSYGKGRK